MLGEFILAGATLAGWGDNSVAANWEETGIEKTVSETNE